MKGDRLGEFEELLLLALQALGDETSVVSVQQYLERISGRSVSLGAVYAGLDRLELKGFVRSAMGESDGLARRQAQAAVRGHARGTADGPGRPARARRDLARDRDRKGRAMTARGPQPPRVGCWLVQLWRRTTRRHDIARDVEDDLLELFEIRAHDRGPRFAARRYILDALSLWRCRTLPETIDDHARYRGGREMLQDIRFAARLFRRQPGLFGMTVAGLALAIGISTAVFSTVKAVAFSGYGISDPESVYRIALNGARFTKPTGPVIPGQLAVRGLPAPAGRGLVAHARGLGVRRSPLRRHRQRNGRAGGALPIGHRVVLLSARDAARARPPAHAG